MNWFHVKAALLAVGLAVHRGRARLGGSARPTSSGARSTACSRPWTTRASRATAKVAERRVAVRKIANEIFDFGEIAKRSMARHWQPLSEAQRTEFVGLFADLLERSYISKIETYGGEKIQYTAERIDGDYATVSTKIITKNGTEVPVDYRMIKRATAGSSTTSASRASASSPTTAPSSTRSSRPRPTTSSSRS